MTDSPILPFASAAIVDGNGKLTLEGTAFLRKIVSKLQGQITQLSDTDANMLRVLGSLTGPDGQLLDLSGINVTELAAIAAVQAPGVMVRDALGQWYGRALSGTPNRVSVTYGDGTAGNPAFDIAATYAGQASLTTLGTIGTGTWNATPVAVLYGGTGATTAAAARTNLGAAPLDSPAFTTSIGFNGTAAISKPTVTGAKGGNAALASLLTALAAYGLITDSST